LRALIGVDNCEDLCDGLSDIVATGKKKSVSIYSWVDVEPAQASSSRPRPPDSTQLDDGWDAHLCEL